LSALTQRKLAFACANYAELNAAFEQLHPTDLLSWAADAFAPHLKQASSFGPEDMVLLDLVVKSGLNIRVFYLDTGRLHQETYDLIEHVRTRYDTAIEAYFPDSDATAKLLTLKGPNSFYSSLENRKECCFIRKVEPLQRALNDAKAWITGQRRDQSITRLALQKIEPDEAHGGIVKLNPLADWTDDQVWTYIRRHEVPYNALHDQGFPSIGCAPCTRAVQRGEEPRAGRWWWETPEKRECGIHLRLKETQPTQIRAKNP
jgi:phosphoadenosine phosphosulfate reductase